MTVIYHNPRCSKSRATLALIQEKDIEPDIVLYLEQTPDADTLRSIVTMLNCDVLDIIRTSDSLYKELGLDQKQLEEDEIIDLVVQNPSLLQRPIVINNGKAAIGRPPENVLSIL